MRREHDVAADGAAHECDDGHLVDFLGEDRVHQGVAQGRGRGEQHVKGEQDHGDAERLRRGPCF